MSSYTIEARLNGDLDRLAAWFIERLADKPELYQFSDFEQQQAGALGYITDVLVGEFGYDRAALSTERGWGFINASTERSRA